MTTSGSSDIVLESFSMALVEAMRDTMTTAIGSPWAIADVPGADSAPEESEPFRIEVSLEGKLNGKVLLEFPAGDAAMLASQLLSESANQFGTEQSDAILNCLEAAVGNFRTGVEELYGVFAIRVSRADEPASDLKNVFRAELTDEASNRLSLSMFLNPALMQSLTLRVNIGSKTPEFMDTTNSARERPVQETANLKLVMGVELNVTLRFGQRQLTLREVLDLTSGSVIELDRQVEEPVELLLDGNVIARGEAVVIDGNYGLRVTEVSQAFYSRPPIQSEGGSANREGVDLVQ